VKLERMLSIITYLMNHEKARAKDLAQKLEVSVRTIYRDVDSIAQAGIPVTTFQGAGGGIGIVEGYRLDTNVLTGGEVRSIVTALKGLHSIGGDEKLRLLIEKVSNIARASEFTAAGDEIIIDLSPWDQSDRLGRLIMDLKKAIRERRRVSFAYHSYEKRTQRTVEPCVVVFKDSNWYLYAYCLLREDFRLFKLRRMRNVNTGGETFAKREFSLDRIEWDSEKDAGALVPVVVLLDGCMESSLVDMIGLGEYEVMEDGRLKMTFLMPEGAWLYGFLLSFGDKAEVIEPEHLRKTIRNMAERVLTIYDSA
jgi:predicted DNA-binding transcriptional regulator YafY